MSLPNNLFSIHISVSKEALTSSSTQAEFDAITDYFYEGGGNITRDLNRGIGTLTGIGASHNHLNQLRVATLYKKVGGTNIVKGSVITPLMHLAIN